MRPPPRLAALAALLVLAVAAPVSDAQADRVVPISADQAKSLGVAVAAPRGAAHPQLRGFAAQVVIPAGQVQVVSAPLGGLVEQVYVASQQNVRLGQVVARLQSPGLADVQHTYLQASAQRELARANLERDEKLFAAGVIAESRLQATRAHHQEVEADVAERTQALRLAGMSAEAIAQLRQGTLVGTRIDLHAPLDGVVLEQAAVVGQRMEAAAPVLRIGRLEPLWLEVQVPLSMVGRLAPGMPVEVTAARVAGRILSIGRSVSPSSQTVLVRAEVRQGAKDLRPGQLVEVVLRGADTGSTLWAIPRSALTHVDGRPCIFVRTPAGFHLQAVDLASESGDEAVIAAPIRGSDRLAIHGVAALKAKLAGIGR